MTDSTAIVAAKPIDLAKLKPEHLCTRCTNDSEEAGRIARSMFDTLERNSIRLAEQAVVFGCFLAECRAFIGHGDFTDWLTKHFDSSRRTAYKYIALAEHFSRSQKLLPDEFSAINRAAVSTDDREQHAEVRDKLAAFVGDQSLSDLYRRYKIVAPRGGNTYERDGIKGRKPTPQQQADANLEADAIVWRQRLRDFELTLDGPLASAGWKALSRDEQEALAGVLTDLAARIRTHLRDTAAPSA